MFARLAWNPVKIVDNEPLEIRDYRLNCIEDFVQTLHNGKAFSVDGNSALELRLVSVAKL